MSAQTSIRRRLLGTFALFAAIVLMLSWLVGVVWFFKFEREELQQNLRSVAGMLAAQSVAAVMFRDTDTLNKDLSVLRHQRVVDWAVIVDQNDVLASFRAPPDDLTAYRARLRNLDAQLTLDALTLRQTIEHDGLVRGELILHARLAENNTVFLTAALVGLLVIAAIFALAMQAFARVLRGVTQPLEELSGLAGAVTREMASGRRAKVRSEDEVGRMAATFNRMLDALEEREQTLAQSRDSLRALNLRMQEIGEEERTRIARELHDELGQQLTALKLAVLREHTGDPLPILDKVDQAIRAVRQLSWRLRPSVLDTLGLSAAIEWLAEDFQRRMGMRCIAQVADDRGLVAAELATDVFRVCQELLTNIARHAGASRVTLRFALCNERRELRLEVEDNGRGMGAASATPSLGLLGIRERIGRWNGRVDFLQPASGRGLLARITIPLPSAPPDHGDPP